MTPAALGFDTLVVNFGSVPFSSSSTRTLTLRNTGGASTSAISLEITGTNANRFAIEPTGNTCSGQTLAGGATCTFTIRFTPTNVGAKTAFVTASATPGGAAAAGSTAPGPERPRTAQPPWPAAASGRVISIPCAPAIATTSAIAGRPRAASSAAARANASIPSPGE